MDLGLRDVDVQLRRDRRELERRNVERSRRGQRADRDLLAPLDAARRARDDLVIAGIRRHVGADEHGDVDAVTSDDEAGDRRRRRREVHVREAGLERVDVALCGRLARIAAAVGELDRVAELGGGGRDEADVLVALGEAEQRAELRVSVVARVVERARLGPLVLALELAALLERGLRGRGRAPG